jgi:hypothetical protein
MDSWTLRNLSAEQSNLADSIATSHHRVARDDIAHVDGQRGLCSPLLPSIHGVAESLIAGIKPITQSAEKLEPQMRRSGHQARKAANGILVRQQPTRGRQCDGETARNPARTRLKTIWRKADRRSPNLLIRSSNDLAALMHGYREHHFR